MITTLIILAVYVTVIVFFIFTLYSFSEFFFAFCITTVVTAVVWVIVNIAIGLIWFDSDSGRSIRTDIVQTELSALSSSSEISGSFFLGSGSVSENPKYTYIVKHADGGLELKSIATTRVIVYELENTDTAYMETATIAPISTAWTFFTDADKIRFYVPEGSVQSQEYEVTTK